MRAILIGVLRGTVGVAEDEDLRLILETHHPTEGMKLIEVFLPAGYTQDQFRLGEEGQINAEITAPKKWRLRFDLVEVLVDAPLASQSKSRRNGASEHISEQEAPIQ